MAAAGRDCRHCVICCISRWSVFFLQLLGACTKQVPYILITELVTGGSMANAVGKGQVISCAGRGNLPIPRLLGCLLLMRGVMRKLAFGLTQHSARSRVN